jgi:hypothetical protein
LFVAMIPPLQAFLEFYMSPMKVAIANAGECSIPLTLVVLGAYFWQPHVSESEHSAAEDGVSSTERSATSLTIRELLSRMRHISITEENKTIIAALLARMFIVPTLIIPSLYYCVTYGLHSAFEEYVTF